VKKGSPESKTLDAKLGEQFKGKKDGGGRGTGTGAARQTQVAIAAGECSRGLWRRLQREEREMDRVRRWRDEQALV